MHNTTKKILVTCALPYANDDLHLGHMLEHIQADIWVRYQKMQGNEVFFICADDAHGTPIMIKAQKLGKTPEKMIEQIQQKHKHDLNKFNINYDNYHSTHSKENKELLINIYNKLKKNGFIKSRMIFQFYDSQKKMFLPDRFIQGNCPICNALEQYGDNCEKCGSIYNSIDLVNPKSTISGDTPIIKKTEHLFFDLPALHKFISNWINSGILQKQVSNKMQEWFKTGLQQWDISRDAPYFGFKIPDNNHKYFYVWLDAPIGYMSSFQNLCNTYKNTQLFKEFWDINSQTELYHFIGKDIIYFHTLFWPAILHASNIRIPTNIFVHGYVMVNGMKISKSRGNFIKASTYLSHLDPDYLRYYYATKLSSNINDINLNLSDFVIKVNSDIINKIVNLASRTFAIINKHFHGYISNELAEPELYKKFVISSKYIEKDLREREFSQAIRKIIKLVDSANYYIDKNAPWKLIKNDNKEEVKRICSMGIQLFKIIMTYLKPIMPGLAANSEKLLNTQLTWKNITIPLSGNHKIHKFRVLLKRINMQQIDYILKINKK